MKIIIIGIDVLAVLFLVGHGKYAVHAFNAKNFGADCG